LTVATGLKRLAIAVAAMVAVAFVTLIALSFLIPAAAVRDAVAKQIQAVTGLDPILRGDVSVSLFPSGTASFHNVLLGDDRTGEPAVVADELTARLRYFPLLAGHIEIADVTLVRPTIAITFMPSGQSNWSGLIDSLAHALTPNPGRASSFSEIGINDGTVIVRDVEKHSAERFDNVDFQVAWPSISRSFGANGHLVWHDEPVEASLTLTDFLAALSGQRSGLKVRIASAPLKIAFDGAATAQPTLRVEGALGVDAPSLRDAMRWTGRTKVPFGGFGRFALRAQSVIGGGLISLDQVNVELDGNSAEGALTLATGEHQMVQGTLAADTLDLSPYVSGVRLLASNDRGWDQLPITLDGLAGLNLDLRLSAASIKIANAQIGRTAIGATMSEGKLNLAIGQSQAFSGTIQGSVGLAVANDGVEAASHLQFTDVDLEDCLSHVFGIQRLAGRGNLKLDVGGKGDSVFAVTNTLNGTARLDAHSGALVGLNVEQLLRRLESRPLSGNGDFRSGRTPFDQLSVNISIDQGVVSVDDMHIEGPAVKLIVGGQASVPMRDLDLKGTATLISNATTTEFDLPFVVQGRWDDPIMLPDPRSLIRHSGAAKPLLDSVKGRTAGDAVRSVIDQLLAQPPAPADDGPAAVSAPAPAAKTSP
jgi:AsmA protein